MSVTIKYLDKNDLSLFSELVDVFAIVFEMEGFVKPPKKQLQKCLSGDNFGAVVALKDGKVIGGLTVYYLEQYYSTSPLAYIYDLAVMPAHQRIGIGKKLIDFINNFCRANGFEEVFVQADRVDGHAVDFYRGTKPTAEEDVLHFYYAFK